MKITLWMQPRDSAGAWRMDWFSGAFCFSSVLLLGLMFCVEIVAGAHAGGDFLERQVPDCVEPRVPWLRSKPRTIVPESRWSNTGGAFVLGHKVRLSMTQ